MIPGNKLYFVPDATEYDFGVLTSRAHNAWMRNVAGRLKSDYNYANTIVYSNLVWPDADAHEQLLITDCARAVLDARAQYAGATLKELYDPDKAFLYSDLVQAHKALDDAVERAYGLEPGLDEKDLVAHLFELYRQATEEA